MSCHGGCGKNTHVTLSRTWTSSGSLKPTKWGPFPNQFPESVNHESYCSSCSSASSFATGSTSWTGDRNVTIDTTYQSTYGGRCGM